ncbi:MAG: hypothetical protein A2Y17_05930 [Clostridiales bacterium GWF2_38_85]|nr:MAG: hypothetical protein A2Y17_05930 [Clostridiales bacterium GWF2_38_85]HBL84571.1 3-oxoacyl-ACP reductase [Clostridiales bacterium]
MKKHVLITGGSRGIGEAIVRLFSHSGYRVTFCYNTSSEAADSIIKSLSDYEVTAIQCDISDINAVKKMINSLPEIDVLVNNAGISVMGLFHELSDFEIKRLYDVNLFGILNCCRAVIPQMVSRKSGVIINISSIWGEIGASYEVDYSVTKAAVIGLTKALSKELAPSGICVNCVSPGVIDTDMNADLSYNDRRSLQNEIPLERFGEPEDVAKAILFLASDDAAYITGHVLSVNGGFGQ